jgi:isopentenyl diphosphate isomerase/L-lactate dehydrogenase-like FMN-dependent dehydrogenase
MTTNEGHERWTIREHYINLADYEQEAKRILPIVIRSYYAAGAADEITLRENELAYRRVKLRPRILRDADRYCAYSHAMYGTPTWRTRNGPW